MLIKTYRQRCCRRVCRFCKRPGDILIDACQHLDCTPAVDKALHLGGLGSVRVEAYPPLPKARPAEAQVGK